MKTSNLNSKNSQSIDVHSATVWQTVTASCALLLPLSPLILNGPVNYWYLPLLGILLFVLALTGVGIWKSCLSKITEQKIKATDTNFNDYIPPVIITQFGKQNAANNQLFKKAA